MTSTWCVYTKHGRMEHLADKTATVNVNLTDLAFGPIPGATPPPPRGTG